MGKIATASAVEMGGRCAPQASSVKQVKWMKENEVINYSTDDVVPTEDIF